MAEKTSDEGAITLHESFLRSVASPDLKDLGIDLAQITLETVTDIEVLKRLPVVGVLAHVCGAAKTVRDRHNLKKLLRFFAHVDRLSPDERAAFLEQMRADPRL